ncbi:MAG: PIG-L deacetylase family protein [Candidatus Dormibacter sp.]|uniref:PIG-L deacetylase family protein n=1 Tax=Candidatus Dormibacter sp. TaxID=2973982 RepID=UPI00269AAF92
MTEELERAAAEPEAEPPAAEPERRPIKRALVVAAHPDDPEFGFGATVAKLTAEGVEVAYCVCTDGSQGGEDATVPDEKLSELRYSEQWAAARVLGVREIRFLGFRDGHLEPSLELRKAISREIRRFRPDLVMTHTPSRALTVPIGASHPDHLAVGEAALSAVYPDARNPRAYPELLAQGFEPHKVAEVWLPSFDTPNHVIDATEFAEKKIEAILCHASQFQKPGMEPDVPGKWVRERMGKIGEKHGFKYAEAFTRLETA